MLQPGVYLGKIVKHVVAESKNGTPQVNFEMSATHYVESDAWVEINPPQSIRWYANLIKKDGAPLRRNIDIIIAALGLSGFTLADFKADKFVGVDVQIFCNTDEYKGKSQTRVSAIYPPDYTGSYGGGDALVAGSFEDIESKFGSVFREFAPPVEKAAKKTPAAAKASPVKTKAAEPQKRTGSDADIDDTKKSAWASFKAERPNHSKDQLASEWTYWVASYRDEIGHDPNILADWLGLADHIAKMTKVRKESAQAAVTAAEVADDDIPF